MPASRRMSGHVEEGRVIAGGFVVEDEAGEEEAFGEEIDS